MAADIQEALTLQSQGDFEQAEKIYLEFLEENPKQPDVSNLLGLIYLKTQHFEAAKKYFGYAVDGFPCAEYFQNLGLVFYTQFDFGKAMECFSKAVDFEPDNFEFIRNFAKMAKDAKQYKKSIEFYEKTLKLNPKDSVGLNNIGILYEKVNENKTAKICYQKSLKIKPNYEAYHNLGVLYRNERNYDESIKCLKQALKLKPDEHESLKSLAMSYLHKKDVENGHKYFHKSRLSIDYQKNRTKYRNCWDGQKHSDKTILVYSFSGYGDRIMFSRYLDLLKKYFKTVKVTTPEALKTLFKKNFPDIQIVEENHQDYDYSVNIMELYYFLKLDFYNIPSAKGYLTAEPEIIKKYETEYFSTQNKKIGLFWQGNTKVLKNRSIRLKELEQIFALKNCDFFSFQLDDEKEQIQDYPFIIDLSASIKDFSHTAAALKNLDVLVTIDSAIAHVAGALGVKTFLLLPYASEWRWFDDTETTPWYDSVTIFKQKEPGDWKSAIEQLYGFFEDTIASPLGESVTSMRLNP